MLKSGRAGLALVSVCWLFATVAVEAEPVAQMTPAGNIVWGKTITLTPPNGAMGRYPRLVRVTQGAHAGDLLLTYQTGLVGGDFMMYRSSDNGASWGEPVRINTATTQWDFASCNIIQLTDGRLLMTLQRRVPQAQLGRDFYMDVRFSADGGETWSAPQQVFQGANWEGRPMEVPHDANGDGIRDIYLFYTQRVIDTRIAEEKATRLNDHGRAIAFIASYDGGKTWVDSNPERFTGQIIHRNYDAKASRQSEADRSGGGMPQPFLLPGDRVGIVVEELDKRQSPMIVANDSGDWDWQGADFKGPWTSADYTPNGDTHVYPTSPDNAWPAEPQAFGKGPYASVLTDGRVVMASRNEGAVSVWLGDKNARNFKYQGLPFDTEPSAFPFIEPLGGDQILVAGGSESEKDNFILLRFGTIKP